MTEGSDLTGRTILVVEDDYYMAHDTAAALRSAGAQVLGPCPTEAAAHAVLATVRPDAAVLDLNLGGSGPKFDLARLLRATGVPLLFLTGYDVDVVPAELAGVPQLLKPVPLRKVVEAVERLPLAANS